MCRTISSFYCTRMDSTDGSAHFGGWAHFAVHRTGVPDATRLWSRHNRCEEMPLSISRMLQSTVA